jgi:hypothetical protein
MYCQVLSAGNPQYGQLGDGSDHMYNAKDSEWQQQQQQRRRRQQLCGQSFKAEQAHASCLRQTAVLSEVKCLLDSCHSSAEPRAAVLLTVTVILPYNSNACADMSRSG